MGIIPFVMEPATEQFGVNRTLTKDHREGSSIPFAE
jgi:hypothetical protein